MPKAYFAPLIPLPTIIDGPGQYRTRCGEVVTIDSVPSGIHHHAYDCYGAYDNGARDSWHPSGRIYASSESSNDIVGPAALKKYSK